MKMKKSQVFTWDLIFGVFIFLTILTITIHIWGTSYDEVRYSEEEYEMSWLAETISEQLVRTAGEPYDWVPRRAVTYGFAEIRSNDKSVDSRLLDADKILYLIDAFDQNYTTVRNKLMGSSRYEMYIELSCVNRSDLSCLQGLELDGVEKPVYCNNYRVGVTNYVTDTYNFFEAEDLWDTGDQAYCLMKGCSGDWASRITGSREATVRVDPGRYMIWVRLLEDYSSNAKLVVEDVEHQMFGLGVQDIMKWNWVGEQELEGDVILGYKDAGGAGYLVDAILFTTNRFYDPNWEYTGTYGNPNTEDVCIIGNYEEGGKIVSIPKTAVISEPMSRTETFMGMQPILDKTLKVKVVVWGGTAVTPRTLPFPSTSTTTTTLPKYGIFCSGSPSFNCNATNPSVVDMQDVELWSFSMPDNTITCGSEKNLTVSWLGRHAGDPNYFSFYLDDANHFVGACQSDNTAAEVVGSIYDYEMNCTLAIPNATTLNIADGLHNLIVLAEDQLGYCSPDDVYSTAWDDRYTASVDVSGCIDYEALACTSTPSASLKYKCDAGPFPMDTVDVIHRVEAEGGTLTCGLDNTVRVYWEGTHGDDDDNKVFWTFLINQSGEYTCIGTCESRRMDDPTREYYEMACTVNPNNIKCRGGSYFIADGDYRLFAVAESYNYQYCNNPNSPDAEAQGSGMVTVLNCETCNNCDPPIPSSIIVTLSDLEGEFDEWEGAHTLEWYSGCTWRKIWGDETLMLWWAGNAWHMRLYKSDTCYMEWAKSGTGIECDPYGGASYVDVCDDSGCPGSCGGTIIVTALKDASLTYYIGDMPGVTEGAELYTDVSGSWALTSCTPAPGWTENQEHTVTIANLSTGVYTWNVMLTLNPPPDLFLYAENQSFDVP